MTGSGCEDDDFMENHQMIFIAFRGSLRRGGRGALGGCRGRTRCCCGWGVGGRLGLGLDGPLRRGRLDVDYDLLPHRRFASLELKLLVTRRVSSSGRPLRASGVLLVVRVHRLGDLCASDSEEKPFRSKVNSSILFLRLFEKKRARWNKTRCRVGVTGDSPASSLVSSARRRKSSSSVCRTFGGSSVSVVGAPRRRMLVGHRATEQIWPYYKKCRWKCSPS